MTQQHIMVSKMMTTKKRCHIVQMSRQTFRSKAVYIVMHLYPSLEPTPQLFNL